MNRREFLKAGAVGALVLLVPAGVVTDALSFKAPLAPIPAPLAIPLSSDMAFNPVDMSQIIENAMKELADQIDKDIVSHYLVS